MVQSKKIKNNKMETYPGVRVRHWAFTCYKFRDYEKLFKENPDWIRYILIGEEVCPKTGRLHLQGYIQFHRVKRFWGVKKYLVDTHIEPCKGSVRQNKIYCCKDGKFKEYGKAVFQGQRTDLEQIQNEIEEGASLAYIQRNHFQTYCRYRNGIKDYLTTCQEKSRKKFRDVHVSLYTGQSRGGKTYAAEARDTDYFKIEAENMKWWDGYNGEDTLIINDYDNDVKITCLLTLIEGYQRRLPIKGAFTYANWTKVIITTNKKPHELHTKAMERHREALFERFDEIKHFNERSEFCKPRNELIMAQMHGPISPARGAARVVLSATPSLQQLDVDTSEEDIDWNC